MSECANAPTLVAGGLLLDGSGHSSGGGFPEWVAPALSGLLCEGGVLLRTKEKKKKQTGGHWKLVKERMMSLSFAKKHI